MGVAVELGNQFGDGGVGFGEVDAVEFSSDLVQRPRQDLAAGRAVCLHVAFVIDSLEIFLIVLQVHLAAYYHGIVVFAERLRLRAILRRAEPGQEGRHKRTTGIGYIILASRFGPLL